jgi:hypothetical protein
MGHPVLPSSSSSPSCTGADRDSADLLKGQRVVLDPIARTMQAPRAEAAGFDEILLAWRHATAAAALGLLDDIAAKTEAGRS